MYAIIIPVLCHVHLFIQEAVLESSVPMIVLSQLLYLLWLYFYSRQSSC